MFLENQLNLIILGPAVLGKIHKYDDITKILGIDLLQEN